MARKKDIDWNLPDQMQTWEQVMTAVLMDIRDELKRLNSHLRCPNFMEIPQTLRKIKTNTTKPRRKRAINSKNAHAQTGH